MNKLKITEQILGLISTVEDALQLRYEPYFVDNSDKVKKNLSTIESAFSGSWLGYHANVYYRGFAVPVPGDGFSPEWGLMDPYGDRDRGGWVEVTDEQVRSEAMAGVDSEYLERLDQTSKIATAAFEDAHSSLLSLLAVLIESNSTPMLEDLRKRVSIVRGSISIQELVNGMLPKGQWIIRDTEALSKGHRVPPHIALITRHISEYSPFDGLASIKKEASTLLKYMNMHDLIEYRPLAVGSKVFIGHGRSPIWRELKDFVQERLSLEWDEFNRESPACLTTKERLQSMMDLSCFALLLLTAEDEHVDESIHARENVIHELGLFQGRLGFRRAVILFEDGCAEFSNIEGLTQIRFPKSNISACFEEIRRVLEREGILKVQK